MPENLSIRYDAKTFTELMTAIVGKPFVTKLTSPDVFWKHKQSGAERWPI
jgi:hypothetical protein